ncbi:hypothetical protein [Streptomyces sp. NPDC048419]|uniref:hypothetical protein n=1 Tax=Streptomyces sp. NPDC048419 TaxID=3365547 RepID=UPI00371144D1
MTGNGTSAANIFEVDPYGELVRLGLLPGTVTARPSAPRTEPAARMDIEELDVFDGARPMTAGLCLRSVPTGSAGLCVRSIPAEPAALVAQFVA